MTITNTSAMTIPTPAPSEPPPPPCFVALGSSRTSVASNQRESSRPRFAFELGALPHQRGTDAPFIPLTLALAS